MNTLLIAQIFERDVKRIKDEVLLYKSDEDLWKTHAGISNTAGTLCLHLIGNLNHFIGALLGKTGYVRDREREFSDRNISRDMIIAEFEKAERIVTETFAKLNDADLQKDFPIDFGGTKNTVQILVILIGHFNYHLGQINYHRRLLTT